MRPACALWFSFCEIHHCFLSFIFSWHVARIWLLPKNQPANIIIRHLSGGRLQLRPSDIKEISSCCFFFSCCWFSFRASILPFADPAFPPADAEPKSRWPVLWKHTLQSLHSLVCVQVSACFLQEKKNYTRSHSTTYTTNLKWEIGKVRAFNEAGKARKQQSKRAKIILWLVRMSWWESSKWLRISSQKKRILVRLQLLGLCVCMRTSVCVRT